MVVLMCQGNLGYKMRMRMDVKKKVPSREPFFIVVGRVGFEPTANGLKVRCSTAELTAHFMNLLLESVTS